MGKEEEFAQLIKAHEGLIFRITTVYTNNGQDQQDLYQEIVYQLWKSFNSFRNEAKISTWMYRVGLNTAIRQLQLNKRRPVGIPIDQVISQQTENYDKVFEERLKLLYQQINLLNVLDKGLMLLLLEGRKYEEIAEITGLTLSNVGTRISRIKSKLKGNIVNNM